MVIYWATITKESVCKVPDTGKKIALQKTGFGSLKSASRCDTFHIF